MPERLCASVVAHSLSISYKLSLPPAASPPWLPLASSLGICYSSESRCAAHAKYHRRVRPVLASAQDIYSMLAHSLLTVHVTDYMYVCIDVWESMYVYECACIYVCT